MGFRDLPEAVGQTLRYEKLFDADYVVIAAAAHPLTRARQVRWERLSREPWILPARSSMVRHTVEEVFRNAGLTVPLPVIESSAPLTNIELVAAGMGVSAVPAQTVRGAAALGQVKRLRVDPPISPRPVALIHRAAPENPRIDWLRRALQLG